MQGREQQRQHRLGDPGPAGQGGRERLQALEREQLLEHAGDGGDDERGGRAGGAEHGRQRRGTEARAGVVAELDVADRPGLLAAARLLMGWPLTIAAVALTVAYVKRARARHAAVPTVA